MFETIAWLSLSLAVTCAVLIAIDEARHPQKMAIMNVVWPVTALSLRVFALWAYLRVGRTLARDANPTDPPRHAPERTPKQPRVTWRQAALADSHCGAGCALADIVTESAAFAVGATLLGSELYASYLWDFLAAWSLGTVFQYFSIQPMRHLPPAQAIWAAVRSDTLSILTFQVGMYGWMALVYFRLFPRPHLHPDQPGYWLMMQVALVCGFLTALPVNRLLVRIGWKEAMG